MKKYVAELIGTMILVLMGCGSAVFAGSVAGTVGAGVGHLELLWPLDWRWLPWLTRLEIFRVAISIRPLLWESGFREA